MECKINKRFYFLGNGRIAMILHVTNFQKNSRETIISQPPLVMMDHSVYWCLNDI